MLVGRPVGRHRQQVEGSGDRVVQGGQSLEGGLALRLRHEFEMEWGELEPADQPVAAAEARIRQFRPWPARIHHRLCGGPTADPRQRHAAHGVAAGGACGLSAR